MTNEELMDQLIRIERICVLQHNLLSHMIDHLDEKLKGPYVEMWNAYGFGMKAARETWKFSEELEAHEGIGQPECQRRTDQYRERYVEEMLQRGELQA